MAETFSPSLWQAGLRPRRLALALLALAALAAALLWLAQPVERSKVEIISDRPLLANSSAGPAASPDGNLPPASESEQPRAALSASFHNFGAIGGSAVVRKEFLLSNDGSAPLVVRRAYTTCGCTSGEISTGVIPPGKAARVTVIFDAGYHPIGGQTVRRGLILETNDPERPQIEIWVQAAVRRN